MSQNAVNAKVSYSKVPSTNPDRVGKTDLIITYVPDNTNQAHSFRIPAENQTQNTIASAIKSHYNSEAKIIPKTVKL